MKTTTKLVVSFTSIIALSGVMGAIGCRGSTSVIADLEEIGRVRGPSVAGLLTVPRGFCAMRAAHAALATASAERARAGGFLEVVGARPEALVDRDVKRGTHRRSAALAHPGPKAPVSLNNRSGGCT